MTDSFCAKEGSYDRNHHPAAICSALYLTGPYVPVSAFPASVDLKKNMTIAVGFTMGIVYMVMDYGIFHLICHSRSISEGYSLF